MASAGNTAQTKSESKKSQPGRQRRPSDLTRRAGKMNKWILSLTVLINILMAQAAMAAESRQEPSSARPRVLEFYASWAEPCKQLKPLLAEARQTLADNVEFESYDVDDPAVRAIVEQYEVCPVPTLVFLDKNNKVVGYAAGFSGKAALAKSLKKLTGDT